MRHRYKRTPKQIAEAHVRLVKNTREKYAKMIAERPNHPHVGKWKEIIDNTK